MDSPFLAPCDKLCSFEDSQVFGDAGKGDFEGRGQVAHGGFALRQACQDAAAGGIGKRAKSHIETRIGILNHLV